MTNVTIVFEGRDPNRTETAWLEAVGEVAPRVGATVRVVDVEEAGWPGSAADLGSLDSVSAVVWFVKFRSLLATDAFDWQGYGGLRVLLDHDAFANWGWQWTDYHSAWNRVFARDRFDLLISTSSVAVERFNEERVRAAWLPKSYDPHRFFDRGLARDGFAHFGTLYPARQAMLAAVRRQGVTVDHVTVRYSELNDALNRFAGCVVCNMDGGWNRVLRRLAPGNPRLWFRPKPGIEVLFKNFEAAAAGCALICDRVPDLQALGFVDGQSMIGYDDFDELADRLRGASPERLRAIGTAGAALVQSRHTHEQRAAEFLALVGGALD